MTPLICAQHQWTEAAMHPVLALVLVVALDSHCREQLLGDALRCCLTVSRRNIDARHGLPMIHR
jgi:hypothetical protein